MEDMIKNMRQRIEQKRKRIDQLEKQRKNYELELQGLDTAIKAQGEKERKREQQYQQSEAQVKKQKEEMRAIIKNIDKKLVKKLHSTLQKKPQEKVKQMAEAFVGVLENQENPSMQTVISYFDNAESLLDRLNLANPRRSSEGIAEKHFETVKRITKSFIDSSTENFKECSPFAPFIAWCTQYIILIRYI